MIQSSTYCHRLIVCFMFGLWCVPHLASAKQPVQVIVNAPPDVDAVLEEALVRLRGELQAVGLTVLYHRETTDIADTPPKLGPDTYAAIVFDKTGGLVHIRVYSAESDAAAQVIDPSRPEVDADVIAVRAVELLRATMLQYARRSHGRGEELPESVRAFTGFDEADSSSRPEEQPGPPSPVVSTPPPRVQDRGLKPEPAAPRGLVPKPRLSLWFAPTFQVQPDGTLPSWQAQASVFFGQSWYAMGAGVATTVTPIALDDPAGTVDIRSNVVKLELRASHEVWAGSEVFAQVGGGAAFFLIEAGANEGFLAEDKTHTTALVSVELGAAQWLHDNIGAYVTVCSSLATDAPNIRLDGREVATLWQPALGFSAGLAMALPDFHSVEPPPPN